MSNSLASRRADSARFATSADGTRIAFEVSGEGQPTVLLHGFTDSRLSWMELGYVDELTAAGRQVVLMDCRGHGDSGKPQAIADYGSVQRMADVLAVLDFLQIERADLVGYSMGGLIALATALLAPRRVASLVVIAAHPFGQDMSGFREALSGGIDSWIELIEANDTKLTQPVRQRMRENDLTALRACVARDRPDFSARLSGLQSPLLAIAGTRDPQFASVVRFADLADGQLLALEGRNHFSSFLADRENISAMLSFFGAGVIPRSERINP